MPTDKYPYVGRVIQCGVCLGFMVVNGHYLGFDNSVHFAISNLTPEQIEKVNAMLNRGITE